MTSDDVEALWMLPATARRPPRLPAGLTVSALRMIGLEVPAEVLQQARRDLQLLYEGDAIDVWEYQRRLEEFDDGDR